MQDNFKEAARRSAACYAETAASNKIQFNGVGGLRTYINSTGISDQP